jgi:hypothetical protein
LLRPDPGTAAASVASLAESLARGTPLGNAIDALDAQSRPTSSPPRAQFGSRDLLER